MQHLPAAWMRLFQEVFAVEDAVYVPIFSFIRRFQISLVFFSLCVVLLFVSISRRAIAQNVPSPNSSMIQMIWAVPVPESNHYRIEIQKSEENHLSAPTYEYSEQNLFTLSVEPNSEYSIRIQSATAYGELSPYSEAIIVQTDGMGRALAVTSPDQTMPSDFMVFQNRPNPFNPSTEISFTLSTQIHVQVHIYNITGQRVATLRNALLPAGSHSIVWDASTYPSGSYFYSVIAGDKRITKKMMFIK